MKNFFITIITLVMLGTIGFGVYWIVQNNEVLQEAVGGTTVYNQEQYDSNWQSGYDTGTGQIDTLEAMLEEYKTLLTDTEYELAQANDNIATLTTANSSLTNNISVLNSSIESLENNIAELEEEILELTAEYESNMDSLTNSNSSYFSQITSLNNTISTLNSQILTLQSLVNDYSSVISTNNSTIVNLQNQISDLTTQNAYYIALIEDLNADNMAVVYFKIDGSTYNYQVITKGSYATVTTPTDTVTYQFLGWSTDGETVITLSDYEIEENTTFIAVLEYNYLVNFVVDSTTIDSTYITSGDTASTDYTFNTYTNKEFVGWSTDGETVITLSTYEIEQDTTFIAVFDYYNLVQFSVNNEIVDSSYVVDNNYATTIYSYTDTNYIKFAGWSTDGETVITLSTCEIEQDTTFIAVFDYYNLVQFSVNNEIVDSSYVLDNSYATYTDSISSIGQSFKSWSTDGETVITLSDYEIEENTTFIAVFEDNLETYYINSSDLSYSADFSDSLQDINASTLKFEYSNSGVFYDYALYIKFTIVSEDGYTTTSYFSLVSFGSLSQTLTYNGINIYLEIDSSSNSYIFTLDSGYAFDGCIFDVYFCYAP